MDARQINAPLLTLHELTATDPPETLAHARDLLLEYGHFVIAQPGAARFCFGTLEQEAAHLPHSFIDRGGGSLIALDACTIHQF